MRSLAVGWWDIVHVNDRMGGTEKNKIEKTQFIYCIIQ